jgi:hypothetical protein
MNGYSRVAYSAFPVASEDENKRAAAMRSKRLNKPKNNWMIGITMDLLFGAGPWVIGVAVAAAGLTSIYVEVNGSSDVFALFNAPTAITAMSTFASFLLVSKQSTNLRNNNAIVGQFSNLSGSLINVCLFIKSQISSGKTVDFIVLKDGNNGFYQTTRIGLVCSSVCYVVKYAGRGVNIVPEGLPIGQDAALLESYKIYTSPAKGSPGMTPFMALVLMIGELVDDFQKGEKPSEYAVLFTQINAITAAEGAIGGITGYSGPYIMKYLLYMLYSLYLLLLLVTDLVPNNEWNSVWISAVLAFCTISFYQISERYGNPMKLRSKRMGQKPMVSTTCVNTEIAITSIFAYSLSAPLLIVNDTPPTGTSTTLGGNNLKFTL